MTKLNHTQVIITDGLIKDFVKYRNDITHGKHRILEVGIAITAHNLCGLIYCCVLDRIGVTREKISELCQYKILS